MISRLEDHIASALFERSTNGVQLTEAGRILYDAVSRGFSGLEAAFREIEDRRTGLQTVTLSVSTGFTTHWMMPRMATFKRVFPRVELRFQLIMSALGGPVSDVDLGMRFVDGSDGRHEATYIMPEILIPICSPAYREAHTRRDDTREQFGGTVINLSEAEPDWSSLFIPAASGQSMNSMIFSDYAIVVQAALLGQGVALGWLNVVAHWLRNGSLVPASGSIMTTRRHSQFVRLRDRAARPIVSEVRDWIIDQLHEDIAAVDAMYPELDIRRTLETRGR
jgi:DNA-binding transcriptional LysR family regulator